MRPARILYCEGNVDGTIGGSYFSLLYLTEGLDRTRYEPLVAFHRETPFAANFARVNVPTRVVERPRPVRLAARNWEFVRRHGWLRVPLSLTQSGVNFARFWWTVIRLAGLLRRERIDLVHLNNATISNHHWMLAALLARVPCVTHERGVNYHFTALARWLAPKLAAIICISEASRQALVESRIGGDNLRVVHNGLDPDKVRPLRAAAEVRKMVGIADDSRVIGLVGNIRQWKGQEVVVRALPDILIRHPEVVCLLVGEAAEIDREYEHRVRAVAGELGVSSRIVFTGHADNVADFLNIMEVAVHASITPEPFGRVLLEAMAMRLPLVASRGGAVTEIVVEGATGLTFTPGNSAELAACVSALLDDSGRAAAMGAAGYRRLVEQFHARLNVERTMAIYDEILPATRMMPDAVSNTRARRPTS